ncbi:D-alanyl-D-alanine carboxypeptidase family protein [Streptomyces wuyuanensis]|uniref:D-alanyl-D-alanine carboxypeptidase family protein n=1 Tax=Streptomyces wuyuanensis TaxID=1196353 RepID=UPI00342B2FFF
MNNPGGAIAYQPARKEDEGMLTLTSVSERLRRRRDVRRAGRTQKAGLRKRCVVGAVAVVVAVTGALAMAMASGAGASVHCLDYPSKKNLDERKSGVLRILNTQNPAMAAAWITGSGETPPALKHEMDQQVKCLEIAADRGAGGPRGEDNHVVVSWRRDASAQRAIWDRKYDFTRPEDGKDGAFGIITQRARKRCGAELEAAHQWDPSNDGHRRCWLSLTPQERQTEILQTSTAPGVSRHHAGTDVDLFSTSPGEWVDGGERFGQYTWLRENAAKYGFIQPYTAASSKAHPAITEERWHWSYYPVSEAILEYIHANPDAMMRQLDNLWKYDPARYTEIRKTWKDYVFHVSHHV